MTCPRSLRDGQSGSRTHDPPVESNRLNQCAITSRVNSYQILLFMFSFHNNLLPKSLLSTFTLDIKKIRIFTLIILDPPPIIEARINTRLFSFVCTGPILWNRLPSTLKNTYTLASFKRNLKKYLNASSLVG